MKYKFIKFAALTMMLTAPCFASFAQLPPGVYLDWHGPLEVEAGQPYSYNIYPSMHLLPPNIIFDRWEVSSPVSIDPHSHSNITFLGVGTYIVRATFMIVDVGPYSVEKTVESHIPLPYFSPNIEVQSLGGGITQFSVTNIPDFYLRNCSVEWYGRGQTMPYSHYSPFGASLQSGEEIMFRLVWGSRYSQWGYARVP